MTQDPLEAFIPEGCLVVFGFQGNRGLIRCSLGTLKRDLVRIYEWAAYLTFQQNA